MISHALLRRRLMDADWLAHPDTRTIFSLLDGEAQRTRAVGGIVRDTLLGLKRPSAELDLATELTPDAVLARAEQHGIAAYPTGLSHGTVTLRLNDLLAEITTLRRDVETDGRHAIVQFGTDWLKDAERRDFTINALYADMAGGLFDPLGAIGDLMPPTVRFIGDPDRRIAEDRLRVYRFFRFSASHGGERFDAGGLAAVKRAAGTLDGLSAERVGAEMRRMLALPRIVTTLRAMRDAGLLAVAMPTLERLRAYSTQAREPQFLSRLAIMMAGEATDFQALWRLSNEEVTRARELLAAAALLEEFQVNEAAYRYPAVLADAIDIAAVLAGWTEAGKSAVLEQLRHLALRPFPLKGSDLLAHGLKPGPVIGLELARLEQLWIQSGFSLDRETLLRHLGPNSDQ